MSCRPTPLSANTRISGNIRKYLGVARSADTARDRVSSHKRRPRPQPTIGNGDRPSPVIGSVAVLPRASNPALASAGLKQLSSCIALLAADAHPSGRHGNTEYECSTWYWLRREGEGEISLAMATAAACDWRARPDRTGGVGGRGDPHAPEANVQILFMR